MTFEQWKATKTRVPNLRDHYGSTDDVVPNGPGLVYGPNGCAGYINEEPDGTFTLELPMQELRSASADELEPELYAFMADLQGWSAE